MSGFLRIFFTLTIYVGILCFPTGKFFELQSESGITTEVIEKVIKKGLITVFAFIAIGQLRLTKLVGITWGAPSKNFYLLLIPTYLILIGILQIKNVDFSQISGNSVLLTRCAN